MNTDQEPNGAPRIVDNRGKRKGPPVPAAFEELTQDDQELLRAQAEADESTPIQNPDVDPILTAFLVTIDHNGNVLATADIETINRKQLSRPATFADMYSAAAHIQKDVNQAETAHRVLQTMQSQAMQMRDQLQAQKIQAQMAGQMAAPRA